MNQPKIAFNVLKGVFTSFIIELTSYKLKVLFMVKTYIVSIIRVTLLKATNGLNAFTTTLALTEQVDLKTVIWRFCKEQHLTYLQ